MSSYIVLFFDICFVLYDVFKVELLFVCLGFVDVIIDVVDVVLEEVGCFSIIVLVLLNSVGDEIGCVFDQVIGEVIILFGFKQVYVQFVEGGWIGFIVVFELGGQGLLYMLGVLFNEMINVVNLVWGNFLLFLYGVIEVFKQYGEVWQQEVFLKLLIEGCWMGIMCLIELYCGIDLGLFKIKVELNVDGSYVIIGIKIFIIVGEYDFIDNIVYLVLVKFFDVLVGVKGILLFVIFKFKVDCDGNVGECNVLCCGLIEYKMGIKGLVICVMNFDGVQGYLVGQLYKGLQVMFIMMNIVCFGVGLQGIGLFECVYQNVLVYVCDCLQLCVLSGVKFFDKLVDLILVYLDV